MNFNTIMLVLACVFIIEGLMPLFFPKQWQKYLMEISRINFQLLRRVGGALVTAGVILLVIFS